jgi:hypothetical protein
MGSKEKSFAARTGVTTHKKKPEQLPLDGLMVLRAMQKTPLLAPWPYKLLPGNALFGPSPLGPAVKGLGHPRYRNLALLARFFFEAIFSFIVILAGRSDMTDVSGSHAVVTPRLDLGTCSWFW